MSFLSAKPLKSRIAGETLALRTRVGSDEIPKPDYKTGAVPGSREDHDNKFKAQVYDSAFAASKAFPEAAPFIATGVIIIYAWVAIGGFLSGESKDSQKYIDRASRTFASLLALGFLPRKWVSDVEFASDYADYLEEQLRALTSNQDPVPAWRAAIANLGMANIALHKKDKNAASGYPFYGYKTSDDLFPGDLDYGNYDSRPNWRFVADVASRTFGISLGEAQVLVKKSMLSFCASHGGCDAWRGSRESDASQHAAMVAQAWLDVSKGRAATISMSGASGSKSSSGPGIGTVAAVGVGGLLAYKLAWPALKSFLFRGRG